MRIQARASRRDRVCAEAVQVTSLSLLNQYVFSSFHDICRLFFENNVPLHLIEDENLVGACGLLGIKLPGRTALVNTLLEEEYDRVQKRVSEQVEGQKYVGISSDGWRKKYAEQGTPLIHFMINLPAGGTVFHRVEKASGVLKDAA